MKYTLDQLYKLIAGAGNHVDMEMLLEALIERESDIRYGKNSTEVRLAMISILQDALDSIRRVAKNAKTRDI